MAGLEGCSTLTSVNGIACAGLISGGLIELKAEGLEKGLVMGFVTYLARSSDTIKSLELR